MVKNVVYLQHIVSKFIGFSFQVWNLCGSYVERNPNLTETDYFGYIVIFGWILFKNDLVFDVELCCCAATCVQQIKIFKNQDEKYAE